MTVALPCSFVTAWPPFVISAEFVLLVKFTVTPFTGKPLLSTTVAVMTLPELFCGVPAIMLSGTGVNSIIFAAAVSPIKCTVLLSLAPLLASDAVTVCSPKATPARVACAMPDSLVLLTPGVRVSPEEAELNVTGRLFTSLSN